MRNSREDQQFRLKRLRELIVSRAVVNAYESSEIMQCSLATAKADWKLIYSMLGEEASEYATLQAFPDLLRMRLELIHQHKDIHDRLVRTATTPVGEGADGVPTNPQEPVDGYINPDLVPGIVATGKLMHEELKGLEELCAVEHKPEPKPPFVGEKDGMLYVGGDNPIPIDQARDLGKRIDQIEERKKKRQAGEVDEDGPTAEDIDN